MTDAEFACAEQVTLFIESMLVARGFPPVQVICFDEISLHRGHGEYVLVISAPELWLALDVLPDRSKENLEKWLEEGGKAWCEAVEVACSDMWDAYQIIAAEKLPNARRTKNKQGTPHANLLKDL